MTTPHSRATARIPIKQHQIEVDAYSPPANLLEVDIDDSQTHGVGKNRYTDYEIKMQEYQRYTMTTTHSATARIQAKQQTLEDAYSPPANFLEIDIADPQTHGVGKKRYTDYEVRMTTNLPVFKVKESGVRRRYSDFEWLRNELERDSKIVVPPLPGKALKRQLPFRGDDGIFEDEFIEERRKGLEQFINKVAGHPLAQNEKCLHMFLIEPVIDKNYIPGKIRTT